MYTCANCSVHVCEREDHGNLPKNCPMNDMVNLEKIRQSYLEPETNRFFLNAALVEAEGYCEWPRLRETIEFCKKMGYKRVGMAFCGGLKNEAKIAADLFRKHGINLITVICKTGGYDKTEVGMTDRHKTRPGEFEPMCNPIAQAELLNGQNTEFNIVLGLCVGHDSLFMKHSNALCTVLVVKDRVLGHNPCAALYTAEFYGRKRLLPPTPVI